MTKQEKIKEAYGFYYDSVKDSVNDYGWIESNVFDLRDTAIEFDQIKTRQNYQLVFYHRPKSLQGIENNNGWTKIENETDLPKENCNVWILHKTHGVITDKYISSKSDFHYNYKSNVTHYRLIEKPEPPIY